jgi:hypothetical protein
LWWICWVFVVELLSVCGGTAECLWWNCWVFVVELLSACGGTAECLWWNCWVFSTFSLLLFLLCPVAPIVTYTITHFWFHIRCVSMHQLLYFSFFSAFFSWHFCPLVLPHYRYACFLLFQLICISGLFAVTSLSVFTHWFNNTVTSSCSHSVVCVCVCVCVCVPFLSRHSFQDCRCINMRPLPELTKGTKLRYPNATVIQPMLNVAAVLCCIRWLRTVYTATAAALVSG